MKCFKKHSGFTLIELLVVILILAILMAIALPLYLRAVADSERQTCRSNMQTIAVACQAYKVRDAAHQYPVALPGDTDLDLTLLVPGTGGSTVDEFDLQALPICPSDTTPASASYTGTVNTDGTITIFCAADDATAHNLGGAATGGGFTPGLDSH